MENLLTVTRNSIRVDGFPLVLMVKIKKRGCPGYVRSAGAIRSSQEKVSVTMRWFLELNFLRFLILLLHVRDAVAFDYSETRPSTESSTVRTLRTGFILDEIFIRWVSLRILNHLSLLELMICVGSLQVDLI